MSLSESTIQWRNEFVAAFHEGDENRAREYVLQFDTKKARLLLEAMLDDPGAAVRQAGAFGLGELGGPASAKRLEQQLLREQARRTHDSAAVTETLTQALGRIQGKRARMSLLRRMERLTDTGRPDAADLNDVACSLWRHRHPDLIPAIRQSLGKVPSSPHTALHGLLVLLDKSPSELQAWAADGAIPVDLKGEVLAVLAEELPDTLVSTLPAFILLALTQVDTAVKGKGTASNYCAALLALILRYPERFLSRLPEDALDHLADMARRLVTTVSALQCALQAAALLKHVGRKEDSALLREHRPEDPALARVFDDSALALCQRPAHD